MRWRRAIAILMVVLAGWSAASADDPPMIDPESVPRSGRGRYESSSICACLSRPAVDREPAGRALRRLAGTGARVARRFSTTPLLALEIDAPALARLEAMRDIVTRVRKDRITPPYDDRAPSR